MIKYRIQAFIPVDVEDEELLTREEAEAEMEQMSCMQPENRYELVPVNVPPEVIWLTSDMIKTVHPGYLGFSRDYQKVRFYRILFEEKHETGAFSTGKTFKDGTPELKLIQRNKDNFTFVAFECYFIAVCDHEPSHLDPGTPVASNIFWFDNGRWYDMDEVEVEDFKRLLEMAGKNGKT